MEKINLKKICYELKDTFLVAGEKSIDLRNKGLIEKIKSDNIVNYILYEDILQATAPIN